MNGKCQKCEEQYGPGAILDHDTGKCKCDNSKQYYGSLTSPSNKCKKCEEYYNSTTGMCNICVSYYGSGYTWVSSQNKCLCQNLPFLCSCISTVCCNNNNEIKSSGQGCQSCPKNTIAVGQQCVCNHIQYYYGAADQCQLCQGFVNKDMNTCSSCSQVYGTGYQWNSDKSLCYCPPGTKCDCSTELCCQQNSTHLINGKCSRCLTIYGPGIDWDQENNVCYCKNTMFCECISDLCCQNTFSNSYLNTQTKQCDCNIGYRFNNGICKKSANKIIIGLAVGIPLGCIFILAIIFIIVLVLKKLQKGKQLKEETKDTIHVANDSAVDTIQISEQVVEVTEIEQNYIPTEIAQ
ncbi:Hypothetical_protein [Hexamita inflata]|uniref:Hypothetical_protein n=1 Tax=Hexamita inflata TaxID=28002 RepID=A0AA86UST4_9EUKA|nr:Hypothetical protein HINF_LOCUS36198 [Hexamita inflata]